MNNDFLSNIELNPKQSIVLHPDNPANEILYGGAAGGGKSFLLRIAAIYYSLEIPGLQTYLLRRKSDDLRANHLEGPAGFLNLLASYAKQGLCKINHTNATINFTNGSIIHLEHCQHEKDMFNFQGIEIHLLLIDELAHFSDKIYRYLRGRCRIGSLKLPEKYKSKFPLIINGSNPGGVGHNFIKAAWIDSQPVFDIQKTDNSEGGMLRQFVPALLTDNPHLEADYEQKLDGLGNPALIKAMKYGSFDITSGGAIDDIWDREIHVVKPFKIPRNWRVFRALDWGTSKPYACLYFAESTGEDFIDEDGLMRNYERGSLFVIAEVYGLKDQKKPNVGTFETAAQVAKKLNLFEANNEAFKNLQIQAGPADTSIFSENNTGVGVSIYKYFSNEGITFINANKNRGSRVAGLEELRNRLSNSLTGDGQGIYFFENCLNSIRTLPTLPRSETNADDIDTKAEDHIYDVIRYAIFTKKQQSSNFDRFKLNEYKYSYN